MTGVLVGAGTGAAANLVTQVAANQGFKDFKWWAFGINTVLGAANAFGSGAVLPSVGASDLGVNVAVGIASSFEAEYCAASGEC